MQTQMVQRNIVKAYPKKHAPLPAREKKGPVSGSVFLNIACAKVQVLFRKNKNDVLNNFGFGVLPASSSRGSVRKRLCRRSRVSFRLLHFRGGRQLVLNAELQQLQRSACAPDGQTEQRQGFTDVGFLPQQIVRQGHAGKNTGGQAKQDAAAPMAGPEGKAAEQHGLHRAADPGQQSRGNMDHKRIMAPGPKAENQRSDSEQGWQQTRREYTLSPPGRADRPNHCRRGQCAGQSDSVLPNTFRERLILQQQDCSGQQQRGCRKLWEGPNAPLRKTGFRPGQSIEPEAKKRQDQKKTGAGQHRNKQHTALGWQHSVAVEEIPQVKNAERRQGDGTEQRQWGKNLCGMRVFHAGTSMVPFSIHYSTKHPDLSILNY